MKETRIYCDFCNTEIIGNYIEIGSENGYEFKYLNKFQIYVGEKQFMQRFQDLHFCSRDHFVKYFFGKYQTPIEEIDANQSKS